VDKSAAAANLPVLIYTFEIDIFEKLSGDVFHLMKPSTGKEFINGSLCYSKPKWLATSFMSPSHFLGVFQLTGTVQY